MIENHTSDYLCESGTDTLERNHMIRTPKMAALTAAMYDQFRIIVEPDIRSEYEDKLKQKDTEIERLKKVIEKQDQLIKALEHTHSETDDYEEDNIKLTVPIYCDYSLFPKNNYKEVAKLLIILVLKKREKGKYLISAKTDLFIVWKILLDRGIFTGNEYGFITFFNECVIPNLTDEDRKERLYLDDSNFSTIACDSPIKKFRVSKWKMELEKQRDEEKCKAQKIRHGEPILKRAVNILICLQQLLEK